MLLGKVGADLFCRNQCTKGFMFEFQMKLVYNSNLGFNSNLK